MDIHSALSLSNMDDYFFITVPVSEMSYVSLLFGSTLWYTSKTLDSLDRILSTTIYVIIFFLRTHPPLVELYLVLFFYAPHCLLDPLICKNPPQVQENWRKFQIEWHTAISQITHCSGLSLSSLTFPFWSWDSSSHIWDLYLLDIKNFDSIWAKVNSDQAPNWKWLWVLHCEELRENHVEMVWKQRKIIWLAVT